MDEKKLIKKFKTLIILNLMFFIVLLLGIIFLEEDIFQIIIPNTGFKGLNLIYVALLSMAATMLYLALYFVIQSQIGNILRKGCAPKMYKTVYFAINRSKGNVVGRKIVEVGSEFMSGNFALAKTLCYDIIQRESNISLRYNAYIVLTQIFMLQNDVENLTALRDKLMEGVNNPKNARLCANVIQTASLYIDFLNGNNNAMIEAYGNAKTVCKEKCNLYLSLYYYALALTKAGRLPEAIEIYQEIIINGNELFVVERAKNELLNFATSESK